MDAPHARFLLSTTIFGREASLLGIVRIIAKAKELPEKYYMVTDLVDRGII
jgi:hypothetical protein